MTDQLDAARTAAESRMFDTCLIERLTRSTNTTTGAVTSTPTQVYAGKCRVQQSQAQSDPKTVGQAQLMMLQLELQLPVATSAGLQVDDRVTITASANDPDLVGRVFYIRDLAHKSEATTRRVRMQERTS